MTNITPNHPCSTLQIVHDILTHELLILYSIYLVHAFWEGIQILRLMRSCHPCIVDLSITPVGRDMTGDI
jgi:hypothetical protein